MISNLIFFIKVIVFATLFTLVMKVEYKGQTLERRAELFIEQYELGRFFSEGAKGLGQYLRIKWSHLTGEDSSAYKIKEKIKGRVKFEAERSQEYLKEQSDKHSSN